VKNGDDNDDVWLETVSCIITRKGDWAIITHFICVSEGSHAYISMYKKRPFASTVIIRVYCYVICVPRFIHLARVYLCVYNIFIIVLYGCLWAYSFTCYDLYDINTLSDSTQRRVVADFIRVIIFRKAVLTVSTDVCVFTRICKTGVVNFQPSYYYNDTIKLVCSLTYYIK
jgi:hypothetical protein